MTSPVGFPTEQLELFADIAPGADLTADPSTWAWITLMCTHPSDASQTISRLAGSPISIKRGIAVGGSQAQTTTANVELFNHDGAITPELVTSAFWPYIDAGTPFRLRMRTRTSAYVRDTYTRTSASGLGTADSGHTYTYPTGQSVNWTVNGTQARASIPNTSTLLRASIAATFTVRDADIVFDCAAPVVATGQALSIGPHLRYQTTGLDFLWCSVDFATTGAIGLSARPYNAGVPTVLASGVPGVSYSAGTLIRARVQLVGDRLRMRAWLAAGTEPSVWHFDARYTDISVAGRVGFFTGPLVGNTNTYPLVMTADNFTVSQPPYERLQGYIVDVQPRFLPQSDGTTWSTAVVTVGGIGSRLEKRQSPSYSPLRRSVQQASITPIAYWPLEDDEGSTFGASAFPDGQNMTVTGPAVFGFAAGVPVEDFLSRYGSKPMVSVAAGARLSGVVPISAVTTEWAVTFVAEFFAPDVPAITSMRILEWATPSGTHNRWALIAGATSAGYTVRAYQDALSTFTDVAVVTGFAYISQATYTIEAHQVGADIFVELFDNDNSIASGTLTGSTQAPVTRVTVNPDRANTTASVTPEGLKFLIGHVRVVDEISVHDTPYYTVPETGVTVSAIFAWYKEPAHRRLNRLCDEERVTYDFAGDPGTTGLTLLNAQQDGAFSELLSQAVESESGGLLFESRYGYRYLPRTARYNAPVALSIDMAVYNRADATDPGDVLVPQLDSRAANYWTIARTNGSSASYAADDAFRQRRGTIPESRTLDVLTDDVLRDHAGWRTHLSVDGRGANYPSVLLDLAANPALIDAWLGCDIGSRVQRLNQPTIAGIGTIDQVVEGITETITQTSWDVVLAATPGSVWDVGVYDDPATVYSPSSTTLSSGINTTVLSLTMAGEPWITGAVSLSLEIDGEYMTATNISGSGNGPYTVTLSARHTNGRVASHLAGAPVNLANPDRWAL